ncbi:hypothetical protein PBRA_000902 [Plasmodiophora brassicae]|uniref:ABC transporter domain-containing protein n=1 Tax=Plasmodiophora brassicae TaxID=37360 RepID=A0A0G4IQT5_PLABS|nr:hypothetical protein PBRA_000902 [Plasmodiophora brassicae]
MLNVLAGRIASGDVSGKVLANGKPRDPQRWRRIASFVEQDDVLFQNLTVRETLLYAAQLRLPSTMAQSEKEARVDAIIEGLGLSACAKTYIGSADKRGISGGERKRVCIGCELVTDPDLLFLDEPTSGLDAFTASSVVETLRALAKAQRKTILTTIHQPRTEILYMFDRVILLALGRCVFSGSIQEGVEYFAAQGFPCPPLTNPSDHFIDTITVDFRSPERRISSLERICTLHDAWVAATAHDVAKVFETADDEPEADALQPASYCNSFAKELGILTRRAMLNVSRDLASIKAIVLKTCIFIVLFGALYFRMPNDAAGGINRIGLLFLVAVHTTMTTMIPIISSFPPIKTIIKRELASGAYRSWSGFLAQTIASLVLPISSTFLFALTVYWIVGLQATLAKYATFVLFLCVHSAVACMIGVSISGVAPNAFVGQIAGSIFVLISLIFGGQVVDLPSVTPYVHYAYVGISQNEFNGLKIDCQRSSKQLCLPEGEMVIEEFSLNDVSLYWNLPANIALGTGALLIGAIAFHYKTRPVMKLSSTPEPEIVLESVSE